MDGRAGDALNRSVVIVGASSLQNKLLAKLVEERTGYACVIRRADHLNGFLGAPGGLALVDAADLDALLPMLHGVEVRCNVAIINAEDGLPFDRIISAPGVRGVFFSGASEEHLVKGIEAIFRGDYWLSRRLLCAHLERTRKALPAPPGNGMVALTRKEMETLRLLASGNTTARIARDLNVSPHTVKTHIYNLFRKIGATNRVQAIHWASQHRMLGE